MKFVALLSLLMISAAFSTTATTTTTTKAPAAPKEIEVTLSDGESSKEGFCKVYASAPTNSVFAKAEVKVQHTKFIGTYRRKVFGKTDMLVGGKLLGELKKAVKAHVHLEITYMKKKYTCKMDYAPNNNCTYSHKYKCKNSSFLMASFKFLALAVISAFFF